MKKFLVLILGLVPQAAAMSGQVAQQQSQPKRPVVIDLTTDEDRVPTPHKRPKNSPESHAVIDLTREDVVPQPDQRFIELVANTKRLLIERSAQGDTQSVSALLLIPVSAEVKRELVSVALISALGAQKTTVIKILPLSEEQANMRGADGKTPLIVAAEKQDVQCMIFLIEHGALMSARDASNKSFTEYLPEHMQQVLDGLMTNLSNRPAQHRQ